MPAALPPSTAWSVRTLDLGRVLLERLVGGVVVRIEVFSGGGFVPSNAVVRIAGRVVAIRRAGEA